MLKHYLREILHFIQYNADGAEIIKFLALKDIPAGEIIYFTDNGWQSPSNTFRTGEGTHTWTSLRSAMW